MNREASIGVQTVEEAAPMVGRANSSVFGAEEDKLGHQRAPCARDRGSESVLGNTMLPTSWLILAHMVLSGVPSRLAWGHRCGTGWTVMGPGLGICPSGGSSFVTALVLCRCVLVCMFVYV